MSRYKEALSYLESFVDYERKPPGEYNKETYSISRTKKLLSYLGNPHNSLTAIHITGTNGKGSTGAMLTSILKEAGFKTGFYSSPHLISFRERIRIGNELIPEEKISSIVSDVKSAVKKFEKEFSEKPSFFEVYTAIAFLYFASEKVDFAVLEVGMGGRLDATNVLTPVISIFTSIDIDHTQHLGSTRVKIAREKSGIIKEGIHVITTIQKSDVLRILRRKCEEKNCVMTEVKVLRKNKVKDDLPEVQSRLAMRPLTARVYLNEESISLEGCKFSVYGTKNSYGVLSIPLLGKHQILNAGLALYCAESLGIAPSHIKTGLRKTYWHGRIQLFPGKPSILLDGAHNPASAKSLASTIKRLFPGKKIILVFGICNDKDISGVGKELFPLAERIILTKADNPRAAEPSYLKKELSIPSVRTPFRNEFLTGQACSGRACSTKAKQALPLQPTYAKRNFLYNKFGFSDFETANSSTDAMKMALNEADDESLICAAGSFFLVGEVLEYLNLIQKSMDT